MKNILKVINFVLVGVLILAVACNPTKSFDDQYDLSNRLADSTNNANYTKTKLADTLTILQLTSTNYTNSSVSGIKTNKYFSDAYPAKTYLVEVLNNSYITKAGNQVSVIYNYYNPLILRDSVTYTVADNEYSNQSTKYFASISDVITYLTANYPTPTRGKTVILTSKITTTTSSTVTFVYTGTEWLQLIPFVLADYKVMGGQSYANFSSTTDAIYYIPIFLKNTSTYTSVYAKIGTKILVQYAVYSAGKTTSYFAILNFDGTNWAFINSLVTATSVVSYNGSVWNFIPPLKFVQTTETATRSYTLTTADYTLVGDGYYKDFDTKTGISAIITKIATILKVRYTDIAADQVYAVTYNSYTSPTTTVTTINIKTVADN